MSVRLEQIIPKTVLQEVHHHAQEAVETSSAPQLPDLGFIAPAPVPNPLLSQGLCEIGMARRFMDRVEQALIEENRAGMSRPWLAPTSTPDEEIIARLAPSISQAASQIAQWLNQDCQGDMRLMQRVLDRFWAKWAVERFTSPDLSSLLLMAYEEVLLEEGGKPAYGLESWPALRVQPQVLHSQPIAVQVKTNRILIATPEQNPARAGANKSARSEPEAIPGVKPAVGERSDDEVEIRLVSVREMLRRYFQDRPQEYEQTLGEVLGLDSKEWTPSGLSAHLDSMRLREGSPALCERLLKLVRSRHGQPPRRADEVPAWGAAPMEETLMGWRLAPRWLPLGLEQKLRLMMDWIAGPAN